jgi:hypothetical protein
MWRAKDEMFGYGKDRIRGERQGEGGGAVNPMKGEPITKGNDWIPPFKGMTYF